MSTKNEFIGVLFLTIERDGSEEKRRVSVYKKGRSITLDDRIGHPLAKILVHPQNEGDEDGWVREYGLCRNVKILSKRYVPPHLLKYEND